MPVDRAGALVTEPREVPSDEVHAEQQQRHRQWTSQRAQEHQRRDGELAHARDQGDPLLSRHPGPRIHIVRLSRAIAVPRRDREDRIWQPWTKSKAMEWTRLDRELLSPTPEWRLAYDATRPIDSFLRPGPSSFLSFLSAREEPGAVEPLVHRPETVCPFRHSMRTKLPTRGDTATAARFRPDRSAEAPHRLGPQTRSSLTAISARRQSSHGQSPLRH